MVTLTTTVSPRARLTYIGISAIIRRRLSTTARRKDQDTYYRSDFTNQPFTGVYEPGGPTEGPLRDASNIGAPRITPLALKEHLDQFVVGQDRAKKTLSTAVYNHYQRIKELERRDEEEQETVEREERRRMTHRHPVEGREGELKRGIAVPSLTTNRKDEFPGQQPTVEYNVWSPDQPQRSSHQQPPGGPAASPIHDATPLTIEKSNILLLGPSGVGKTLMAKTLARVLEVPVQHVRLHAIHTGGLHRRRRRGVRAETARSSELRRVKGRARHHLLGRDRQDRNRKSQPWEGCEWRRRAAVAAEDHRGDHTASSG